MRTRRIIGGYIWKAELARLHRSHDSIRDLIDNIIESLGQHPLPIRLLLTYAAQIALKLNEANSALRELEAIAQEEQS